MTPSCKYASIKICLHPFYKGALMYHKLFFSIIIACLLTSHNAKGRDYQHPYSSADIPGTSAYFARSVFASSIGDFLKDIFNAPAYAENFLPNNFFHMIELLQYGNQTGKDNVYVRAVIRLFANKMKASSYINAYAFSDLLSQLPSVLDRHFAIKSETVLNSLKDIIYELQYQSFKSKFPEFKASPETFLSNLAQQIEDAAELRKLVNLFLEVCLNKLIWSPQDQFETWQNTKVIADQLACLYQRTIIADLEDLNSLCITLLERYCFFLDVAGAQIDIATYEKIKEDINTCRTPLLDLAEQEDVLETKAQRLSRCILSLEAKARARESGIVV